MGGTLAPVATVGTTETVFSLKEPGFFDAGLGVIPGIPPEDVGMQVTLELRAWTEATPFKDGASGAIRFEQASGSWDPASGTAPTGVPLAMPYPLTMITLPEGSTFSLAAEGIGLVFVWNILSRKRKVASGFGRGEKQK